MTHRLRLSYIVLSAAISAALWPASQSHAQTSRILPPDPGLDGGQGGHWGLDKEENWIDNRRAKMDHGPFIAATIQTPSGVVLKALNIRLGDAGQAAVCFDTQQMSYRAGWRGGFIAFTPARFGLIEMPRIAGPIAFTAPPDEPKGDAKRRYDGHYVHGNRIVLAYHIDDAAILESPWVEAVGDSIAFTRTIRIGPTKGALTLPLIALEDASTKPFGPRATALVAGDAAVAIALVGDARASLAMLGGRADRLALRIPPADEVRHIKLLIWSGPAAQLDAFAAAAAKSPPPQDVSQLTQPAAPRWGKPIVTQGHVAPLAEGKPFAIDTLTVPYDNPFNALLFLSGNDFFSNGDAAVCSVHGDVWLVKGIDDKLDRVTWQRFAAGLYQPLGLRIVNDKVHVIGRDRLTILHDRNGDGEADFYQNLSDLIQTSPNGHDYVTCLEVGPDGSFHYADPRGLHRISPDGSTHTTLATGWRFPNGISVSPDPGGPITVAPQEGEWTPSSMIDLVTPGTPGTPGGYYGYGGPKVTPNRPLGHDPHFLYLPRLIDNSSGSQIWVTSDAWSALKGQLLNLSYGRSSIQLILREQVEGVWQGTVVPLDLRFISGVMRGAFNPRDGQLYLTGMKGWVTNAVRDGCFQRLRYTGGKLHLPLATHAHRNGIRITFDQPLDRETAEDIESYALEQWNYRYSAEYGSKEYSLRDPKAEGHDPLTPASARLLDDDRTVFLELPGLQPVHQLRIRYNLEAADAHPVRGELCMTINRLSPSAAQVHK